MERSLYTRAFYDDGRSSGQKTRRPALSITLSITLSTPVDVCQPVHPLLKLAATRRCTRSWPRQFCDGRLCPSVTAALADLADLADGHGMKT